MVKLQEEVQEPSPPDKFFSTSKMGGFLLESNFNRKLMEDKYGFRLQELNHNNDLCNSKDLCDDTVTSVSGHSTYKQRIDSMFDDSRSVVSDRSKDFYNGKKTESAANLIDEYQGESDKSLKNNIQEKIEKMFEEISLNGFNKINSIRNFQNHNLNLSRSDAVNRDFKVIYLGSRALNDKAVSLITLQEPLKDLYLEHKKKGAVGFDNRLTISRDGLKIKINENITLNPFSNIAVWASVKFSCRQLKKNAEYAFLPLIKDPDGIDKNMLYREMNESEKHLLGDTYHESSSQPIFSVVMKNGAEKVLECHGFICTSSEEAIVIAANLYQALMKKMKKRKNGKTSDLSSSENMSAESELERGDKSKSSLDERKKTPPPVPSRPPRKTSKEKQDAVEVSSEAKSPTENVLKNESKFQHRRGSVPSNIFSVNAEPVLTFRRSVSERRNNGIEQTDGDILTKVAIPRSRSFLNANGPLTRYSRRYKMGAHSDGEVTSPLGFNELFNEFRQNEGLESMDDILNAIIDAEGMSFNDLKPIYKEFLLKLAVTLTKDELFQRSKNIMRRQKKKSRSRSMRKKTFVSANGLRKVFRKTASKLSKQKNSRPSTLEFTSVVFQRNSKHFETSTSSTGSSDMKKREIRRRQSSRRRPKKSERKPSKKVSSTSDDSDFFIRKNGNDSGGFPNRSSSGYFSCSECSYDSENCTCTSTDKCYCTLGKKDRDKMSVSSCGRDTESCVDSEKCYCSGKHIMNLSDVKGICQTPHLHQNKVHNTNCPNYLKSEKNCKKHSPTIFEQLKEQGFAASDSSLSRAASPSTAWRNNEERVTRPRECLKASKSLEFFPIQPPKAASRQQIHECPPPPLVAEPSRQGNFVEGTRHYCYHGQDMAQSQRKASSTQKSTRRQYSSMRSRTPQMDVTTRLRHRAFSSMRAKPIHDNIMNHVLFPDRAGSTTSSLRFTRRIDVYNSFQGRRCVERPGSYIDILNQIPARFDHPYHHRKDSMQSGFNNIQDRSLCSRDSAQIYMSSGGSDNFQKLDYDLFMSSTKSESSDTPSNRSDRKVLVVSARDPKGKVLYMGASSRGENVRNIKKDKHASSASEALSVKKSAEIAALFSDVYGKQKQSKGHSIRDVKPQIRSGTSRLSNMENTLGYLP